MSDSLLFSGNQVLLLVADRPKLVHLGTRTTPFAADLHQHRGITLLSRHGCRGIDDGKDFRVDFNVQVLLFSDVIVSSFYLATHKVGKVATYHAVADVADPLYERTPQSEHETGLNRFTNRPFNRNLLNVETYASRQVRNLTWVGEVVFDLVVCGGEIEYLLDT